MMRPVFAVDRVAANLKAGRLDARYRLYIHMSIQVS